MKNDCDHSACLHTALASPMRLEIVGLFIESKPLSVSDMAARLARPATSLYHHVQLMEDAGVLRRAGTRPKGKRFETLFELVEDRMTLGVEPTDPEALRQIHRTMTAALRMAERDFAAALKRHDVCAEGPGRNLIGMRLHIRASAEVLAKINDHLQAIERLFVEHGTAEDEFSPDDQFLSLTLLLAPLRGRRAGDQFGEFS